MHAHICVLRCLIRCAYETYVYVSKYTCRCTYETESLHIWVIYMCVLTHTHMYILTHTSHMYVYKYTCMHTYVNMPLSKHTRQMYMCRYICIYICMHICRRVNICMRARRALHVTLFESLNACNSTWCTVAALKDSCCSHVAAIYRVILHFILVISKNNNLNCWMHATRDTFIWRGGGLGSRPKKMYGERLGDGVEYHLMSPTPRR